MTANDNTRSHKFPRAVFSYPAGEVVPPDQLAKAINDYWHVPVAHNENGVLRTHCVGGVPARQYWPAQYAHPDIVIVRKVNGRWQLVE